MRCLVVKKSFQTKKRQSSTLNPRGCVTVALCHASRISLSNQRKLLVSITTSNTPVPVALGLPRTMFPEGVVRLSKSPNSVASERNAAVVSYEALSRGDGFVEIPLRLNGLYPPSNV